MSNMGETWEGFKWMDERSHYYTNIPIVASIKKNHVGSMKFQ
jgi:hypothetical protein